MEMDNNAQSPPVLQEIPSQDSATLRPHDLMTLQHYNYYSSTLRHDSTVMLRCKDSTTVLLYMTLHLYGLDKTMTLPLCLYNSTPLEVNTSILRKIKDLKGHSHDILVHLKNQKCVLTSVNTHK